MKVHLLGTGAAEGIPAFYCRCRVCREAAERGGVELRTRSSVFIDGTLKFDNGPDTYAQKVRHRLDLTAMTALVFTHAHEDHFTPTELIWRARNFIQAGVPKPLSVFGNAVVGELLQSLCERYKLDKGEFCDKLSLKFTQVEPFVPFATGPHTIHPVRATHDPNQVSHNYVVMRDGRAVLIGFDTGRYDEATWEYLSNFRLDCALMDCTTGQRPEGVYHMGLEDNLRVREEMLKRGIIDVRTRYVLTHISHGGGWLHTELKEHAAQAGMIAAFDGMVIDV